MSEADRRLIAIMFTDIVGYSRMMAKDEAQTLSLLHRQRDLLLPLIAEHHGVFHKEMGDGTLSTFSSAVEALQCAQKIQSALAQQTEFRLRIGLHVGDVVFEGTDIFGDGVNTAARIEPLAQAGGIAFSEAFYGAVRMLPLPSVQRLGLKTLKNLAHPIIVYALPGDQQIIASGLPSVLAKNRLLLPGFFVAASAALLWLAATQHWFGINNPAAKETKNMAVVAPLDGATPVASNQNTKSIAVLAFADLSPGHDQEYFSDGMAEEILDALAQVQDLKVTGRTSSFSFKGKNDTVQSIGEKLGVAHVLEGSVRTQGNKVRITAQLIQTKDGFHLWSQSYDGDLSNVFELQERIARAITEQLKVVLQGEQTTRLASVVTVSAEAHSQFLQGRYFLHKRGLLNLQNAAAAFELALKENPGYAEAWAGLAQTYAVLPEYSSYDPASTGQTLNTIPQALHAVDQALRIDPNSSAALAARAVIRFSYQFDWQSAETDFRNAIVNDPNDSTTRQWYGELLMHQRRWAESLVQFDKAIELDPLAAVIQQTRAMSLWYGGQPELAVAAFEKARRLDPNYYFAFVNGTMVLAQLKRYAEARELVSKLPEHDQKMMFHFIDALQDRARVPETVQLILAHRGGGLNWEPAMLVMLGENDLALTELETKFAVQDPLRPWLYAVAAFVPLHTNPRFQALLKQIGLPISGDGNAMISP